MIDSIENDVNKQDYIRKMFECSSDLSIHIVSTCSLLDSTIAVSVSDRWTSSKKVKVS